MLEIKNGRVFVDGKETINPELIGYAILDQVESHQDIWQNIDSASKVQSLIENNVELELLDQYINANFTGICIPRIDPPFKVNRFSTQLLIDLVSAMKSGLLTFNADYNGKQK